MRYRREKVEVKLKNCKFDQLTAQKMFLCYGSDAKRAWFLQFTTNNQQFTKSYCGNYARKLKLSRNKKEK